MCSVADGMVGSLHGGNVWWLGAGRPALCAHHTIPTHQRPHRLRNFPKVPCKPPNLPHPLRLRGHVGSGDARTK